MREAVGHVHEADCGSSGTTSGLNGACTPPVFEDGEGSHSSSAVLWGAMLGCSTIFERATSTVGWRIGVGRPAILWARANDIKRGM